MSSDWRHSTDLWMADTAAGSSGYMAAWNSVWTRPGSSSQEVWSRCQVSPGEMPHTLMLPPSSLSSCRQPSSSPVTANLVAE